MPRSWDALYNALTDATLREALGSIEADVLVTTTPELLAVVAQLAPADVALVHQEHRASSSRVNDLGALLQFAPRADVVVSLTESMSRWLAGRLGGAAPELQVIPNPLPSHPQPRSPLDQKTFVTAGRLAPEKQFEHVVDAFWRIHEQLPGWTLHDLGRRAPRRQPRRAGAQARARGPRPPPRHRPTTSPPSGRARAWPSSPPAARATRSSCRRRCRRACPRCRTTARRARAR